MCVPRFLLDLSDRQAAEAVRCRIDVTYALALELADPGFHPSASADFRGRLARSDRADRLLGLAPARLKDARLVRKRTPQRTDATPVLAVVRDPTRPEPVTEAVRGALEELARTAPLLAGLVGEVRGRRCGRPARPGKNPTCPTTRITTGRDAYRLPDHLWRHQPNLEHGPRV
ncbi:hypothetical protein GCM10010405_54340 [Streptomyces macrosporus]|uniref:Transposase InsH N-terminal domain-containing protein n=1 Tax=Streptomyces macrosporus TaxID=44032 RepID=A0ABN3KJL4_9ACTN